MTKWTVKNIKPAAGAIEYITSRFKITPLAAEIMLARGLNNMDEADRYLNAGMESLYRLADLPEVKKAFALVLDEIKSGGKIVIYGDYDVDGVTSTVILCKALRLLGGSVDYFIPDRHTDGYGLNPRAVRDIAQGGCSLLITCDNGIAAKNEIDYARSMGLKVLILDHHEPPFEEKDGVRSFVIPSADAVVDMKIPSVDYPFRDLCAGGLCYKFVRELFTHCGKRLEIDDELVVFAALATVCDVVALRDENRIIAKSGLEIINRTISNKGLAALVNINNLGDKRITEFTFGFVIGPCINAGGRLEVAELAARLFMSDSNEECNELAQHLFDLNQERKDMTSQSVERLCAAADNIDDRVLVMYDEQVDESIAGIVAGRLRERYNKPSIVLTQSGGTAKGSGRSIETYDMFEELSKHRELFIKFGGHKMAAGMSLEPDNVEPLRRVLNDCCTLTPDDMERVLNVDKIIRLDEVSLFSARDMELFKPCGSGNSEPLMGLVALNIVYLRFVGSEKNIAVMTVSDSTGNSVSAVMFDGAVLKEMLCDYFGSSAVDEEGNLTVNISGIKIDVIASLQVDDYNGFTKPKIMIKDVRLNKSCK